MRLLDEAVRPPLALARDRSVWIAVAANKFDTEIGAPTQRRCKGKKTSHAARVAVSLHNWPRGSARRRRDHRPHGFFDTAKGRVIDNEQLALVRRTNACVRNAAYTCGKVIHPCQSVGKRQRGAWLQRIR